MKNLNKRSYLNLQKILLTLCISIFLNACATPSSPTGGSADKESPKIINTNPNSGTTNFKGEAVTFEFSEFIKRSSLIEAIRIEPTLDLEYELNWGRKSVTVEFVEPLPDSTTVIVTIGTAMTDTKGNKLTEPVSVAVSTGSTISEGRLTGYIKNADDGSSRASNLVFLMRDTLDMDRKAFYVGETDTSGKVDFKYLNAGTYTAFWVDDVNRNKKWEPQRESAQPFSQLQFTLEKNQKDTLGTIYVPSVDTTGPVLRGVGLFSQHRVRLRFSEPVRLADRVSASVLDSAGNPYADVRLLYQSQRNREVVFARSNRALKENNSYLLSIEGVEDQNRVAMDSVTHGFTGTSQTDTTTQRIVHRPADVPGFPDQSITITYAKPISSAAITDSVIVIAGDKTHRNWTNVQTSFNKLIVSPDGRWNEGISYQVRYWNPLFEIHESFDPGIWYAADLGGLEIQFADSARAHPYQIRLSNRTHDISMDTTATKQIIQNDLPPINYKLRVYQDLNNNGRWDHGSVSPYKPPEPYHIRKKVPVKSGLTGTLKINMDSNEN